MSTPKYIWWNGQVREWGDATIHVTAETAVRGTNVFEGLRAYWRPEPGQYVVVALQEHLQRLRASARLMHLTADTQIDALGRGVGELIRAGADDTDLYLRTAVYLVDGRYTADGDAMSLGSYVVAYPVRRQEITPVTVVLSTWRHLADSAFPTAAKVGAAYSMFRLARIDAESRGADEAILLNDRNMVAETGGGSVFIVRRGALLTPPLSDGILDSITRRIVGQLAGTLDISCTEQSLSKSDLLSAEEVFIAGTLDEIKPVSAVDGLALAAPGPVTARIAAAYSHLCRVATDAAAGRWLTRI